MIRPEVPASAGPLQGVDGSGEHGDAALVEVFAHGHGVEDRGDAGRGYLGVMGEESGQRLRPDDLRARDHVPFEVVRVQFHETRNEPRSLTVNHVRAFCAAGAAHAGNNAVTAGEIPLSDALRCHEQGVFKNGFLHD